MRLADQDWLGTLRPACLNSLAIPPGLRVAVLAPHPDDFDAAGVTLRVFQRNGNRVSLAVLTSGAGGVEDGFCSPPARAEKARIRENEQRASCRFFGLPPEKLALSPAGGR